MTDYTEGELRLIKVVQSHAMDMSHLSPELQDAIQKTRAGLVKNGTPAGTVSPQAPRTASGLSRTASWSVCPPLRSAL